MKRSPTGDNYIGDVHILLALPRDDDGEAARLLDSVELDREAVRERALAALLPSSPRASPPARRSGSRWRYRVVELDEVTEAGLQPHGDEGWELVAITGSGPYRVVFARRGTGG